MIDLSKVYEPKDVEKKWYDFWIKKGLFSPTKDKSKTPFTIVIPPPNVTGILHMGHALNNTIQDILIRYKKLQGFNTLWIPGTDHAGIATQNVVEKRLAKEGKKKEDLGRDKFIETVWQWKEEHGNTIISQLKRLGCACDWTRERFTMDEGLSQAVQETFVSLYEKGLIYRGNYIINWCPRCKTALSDEEAEHKEKKGSLYYLRYPIKGSKEYIVVATTRPETMFGDVAVAINPEDKRAKKLEGKMLLLPLLNKEIPIIKDEHVDLEFGTGFVKVTPAHDPNDFEIGLRHNLEPVNVMNDDATMKGTGKYDGMDRFACREAVIADLKNAGLIEKIEEHENSVGHCYRCDTMVEPRLSKQWFVKMKPLSEEAIKVVREGKISFHPERWEKIYLNWMENIRDWCISRQIWWGHRIPVWYCKYCEEVIVSRTTPHECPKCENTNLEQEKDVLDTWFSSWLWPISTLGWPKETEDLKYFYPTNVLVTAQEIIFFWVARMIVAGLFFKKQIPFSDVYIHGTVRDETGRKMSKSLGNTIDPIEIIENFSADALRFSIIMITSQGQDVYLSTSKFEIGRNFTNKIWNASRFVLSNVEENEVFSGTLDKKDLSMVDKWILSRLNKAVKNVAKEIEQYRFNEAAHTIYDFIWHDYCDWYIEIVKPKIKEKATRNKLLYVLENSLRILHPMMPFITEEIWQKLPIKKKCESIMDVKWPFIEESLIDESLENEFNIVKNVIQLVRNTRREFNVAPAKTLQVLIKAKDENVKACLERNFDMIKAMAKIETLEVVIACEKPQNATAIVFDGGEIFVKLEGLVNIEDEKNKIQKNIDQVNLELKKIRSKLSNKDFVEKAPAEVVEKDKAREQALLETRNKLESQMQNLG